MKAVHLFSSRGSKPSDEPVFVSIYPAVRMNCRQLFIYILFYILHSEWIVVNSSLVRQVDVEEISLSLPAWS